MVIANSYAENLYEVAKAENGIAVQPLMRQANACTEGSAEASGHSPAEGPGRGLSRSRIDSTPDDLHVAGVRSLFLPLYSG